MYHMTFPFATLALVQNTGGLYVGCVDFSRDYTLPSGKACGAKHQARGGEILPMLEVG